MGKNAVKIIGKECYDEFIGEISLHVFEALLKAKEVTGVSKDEDIDKINKGVEAFFTHGLESIKNGK